MRWASSLRSAGISSSPPVEAVCLTCGRGRRSRKSVRRFRAAIARQRRGGRTPLAARSSVAAKSAPGRSILLTTKTCGMRLDSRWSTIACVWTTRPGSASTTTTAASTPASACFVSSKKSMKPGASTIVIVDVVGDSVREADGRRLEVGRVFGLVIRHGRPVADRSAPSDRAGMCEDRLDERGFARVVGSDECDIPKAHGIRQCLCPP